ncbi:hypothetical protein NMY22_g6412 [Coprinellus aureogranulatus]|nr:hypothetical protein NMY22_g6412 [Coprinellus aureogranulatus]
MPSLRSAPPQTSVPTPLYDSSPSPSTGEATRMRISLLNAVEGTKWVTDEPGASTIHATHSTCPPPSLHLLPSTQYIPFGTWDCRRSTLFYPRRHNRFHPSPCSSIGSLLTSPPVPHYTLLSFLLFLFVHRQTTLAKYSSRHIRSYSRQPPWDPAPILRRPTKPSSACWMI